MTASLDGLEGRISNTLKQVADLPVGSLPSGQTVSDAPKRGTRKSLSVAAVLILVSLVLIAVVLRGRHTGSLTATTGRQQPAPPVTLPKVVSPAGSTPIDYGMLRLRVPKGWTSLQECTETGVTQYGAATFSYLPAFLIEPTSQTTGTCGPPPASGDWVEVRPLDQSPPEGWSAGTVNEVPLFVSPVKSGQETVDLPSMQFQLVATGRGRDLLGTLSSSSLAAVLHLHAPVAVPSTWRSIDFGGITARVPNGWPVTTITNSNVLEPGFCGAPYFDTASVFLGKPAFLPLCHFVPRGLQVPTDGVWFERSGEPSADQEGLHRALPFGPTGPALLYTDEQTQPVVYVELLTPAGEVDVVVGLGSDPKIAEEILSSLRANANSTVPSLSTTTRATP